MWRLKARAAFAFFPTKHSVDCAPEASVIRTLRTTRTFQQWISFTEKPFAVTLLQDSVTKKRKTRRSVRVHFILQKHKNKNQLGISAADTGAPSGQWKVQTLIHNGRGPV